ncbi:alpha/beta fold hydrolase [Zooshikella sp. RANM57]|uniref:alpha/beta fold hydrolase n=1 Tax=Zooshikella sp. RANM57 TaxID=3425863 RepID=UPI003D6E4EBC
MSSTQIHFSHANGFPAPSYRQLFSYLDSFGYNVGYLAQHGHNPRFPVNDNWEHLVAELIHTVRQRYQQPVIAVGHSLGGFLSLSAASQQPQLFRAVVMLDSPLLTRMDQTVVRLAKRLGFIDRITPAGRTQGRRTNWPDIDQAKAYFASKSLFKYFEPACLHDYLTYGLQENNQGVSLRYDVATELQIYRTIPHQPLRAKLTVPTALLFGQHSRVVAHRHRRMITGRYRALVREVPGGHMFPFEHPKETAEQIHQVITHLLMRGEYAVSA